MFACPKAQLFASGSFWLPFNSDFRGRLSGFTIVKAFVAPANCDDEILLLRKSKANQCLEAGDGEQVYWLLALTHPLTTPNTPTDD